MLICIHIYLTGCIAIFTKPSNQNIKNHKHKPFWILHDEYFLPRWRRWSGDKRSINGFSFSSETLSLLKLFQYRLKVFCKLSINNLLLLLNTPEKKGIKQTNQNSDTNIRRKHKVTHIDTSLMISFTSVFKFSCCVFHQLSDL